MNERKIRTGITIGDINGIGPEIIVKVFSDIQMLELCTPVVYGSAKALTYYRKGLPDAEHFQFTIVRSAKDARAKKLSLVECFGDDVPIEPGKASKATGRAALSALEMAVKELKSGAIDVLVTAPINKETIQGEGFDFKGHTEFLASNFGGTPLMLMCSDQMKVGLVTIHMPVREIAPHIGEERIIELLERLRKTLISDFEIVQPRIAVLSLNPHAGDGGLLGSEEEEIIKPALAKASENGILAFGPFSADGFFASAAYSDYDAVLAMYHDQGLIPFKSVSDEGINFSAGLKVIRTSPDHGTAYDIAGEGRANPASMRKAIFMATDIFRSRQRYEQMSGNPLKHYEREKSSKDLSVKDLLPDEEGL